MLCASVWSGRKVPRHARARPPCVQATFVVDYKRLVACNQAGLAVDIPSFVVANPLKEDWGLSNRLNSSQKLGKLPGRSEPSSIHAAFQSERHLFPAVGYASNIVWVGCASAWQATLVFIITITTGGMNLRDQARLHAGVMQRCLGARMPHRHALLPGTCMPRLADGSAWSCPSAAVRGAAGRRV